MEQLHFLIDFENVGEAGLDGIEYLQDTDALTLFYSKCCEKLSRRWLDGIIKSGCDFQVFKLKNVGKNALDFYIISRIGELLGAGYAGKLIVVSRDKGYRAMRDYWNGRGIPGNRILLKPSVREGIAASNENSDRRRQIAAGAESVRIDTEYTKYQERRRMENRLAELFQDTEYAEQVAKICALTEEERSPRALYLGSLKRFGRADGVKIYRYLRRFDGIMNFKEPDSV